MDIFITLVKNIPIGLLCHKTKFAITVAPISACQRINCSGSKIECVWCAERVQAGSTIVPWYAPCLIRSINIVSKHTGPGLVCLT